MMLTDHLGYTRSNNILNYYDKPVFIPRLAGVQAEIF